jgi:DNA-binding response OmpR family regulator
VTKDKILIIEDNPTQQVVYEALAKRAGVESKIIDNGLDAVTEISKSDDYALVIVDWQIFDIDGLECTRQIRKYEVDKGKHIPIVAISALGRDDAKKQFLEAGADEYYIKPFTVEDFDSIIRKYCAKQRNSV